MSSETRNYGPGGTLETTEHVLDEPHSVEVGFDSKGTLYVKSVKAYVGRVTDIAALEDKLTKAVDAMVRVAKLGRDATLAAPEDPMTLRLPTRICNYCEHEVDLDNGSPFGLVRFGDQRFPIHAACFDDVESPKP